MLYKIMNYKELEKTGKNWKKLGKTGKNWKKLEKTGKTGKNWKKLEKTGKNGKKWKKNLIIKLFIKSVIFFARNSIARRFFLQNF